MSARPRLARALSGAIGPDRTRVLAAGHVCFPSSAAPEQRRPRSQIAGDSHSGSMGRSGKANPRSRPWVARNLTHAKGGPQDGGSRSSNVSKAAEGTEASRTSAGEARGKAGTTRESCGGSGRRARRRVPDRRDLRGDRRDGLESGRQPEGLSGPSPRTAYQAPSKSDGREGRRARSKASQSSRLSG